MNGGELIGLVLGILIFGAGIAALSLVLDVLFPSFVRRARTTAERMPIRSAIVGFINFAFFSILGIAILSIAQEADNGGSGGGANLLRLIGGIEILGLLTFIAFGIAAIARWVGERMLPDGSAVRQSLSGVLVLELAALAPFVGWILVPLSVILVGYGAVIIALVWRRNA